MNDNTIKAFIVDDSAIIRFALTQLLNQEAGILVVGDAPASPKLLKEIEAAKPDVLVVDIPLPRDHGIEEVRKLKKLRLPVIVFTKSSDAIAKDLVPLLEAGAVGFVLKPEKDEELSMVREQLVHELRLNVPRPQGQAASPKLRAPKDASDLLRVYDPPAIVAIGSSTGGPEALSAIIGQFPAAFKAGVVITQHMPADFTARFAKRLSNLAHLTVKEAAEGDVVKEGLVLVAPGDYHMTFVEMKQGPRVMAKVRLTKDPPQWGLRPAVDPMMLSLVRIYRNHMLGVILTGMGQDGVVGMRALKEAGGHTLVQNQATSVVYGMAQEVVKNNLADEVLPLKEIVPRLITLVQP